MNIDEVRLAAASTLLDEGHWNPTALYRETVRIFWETAGRSNFPDEARRSAYHRAYFGYYWERSPELFFLAVASTHERPEVLGYICGVSETRNHPELWDLAGHIELFEDLYSKYPAHLHINLTERSRGAGLGGRLLNRFEEALRRPECSSPGVHLITGLRARNRRFYERNDYEPVSHRSFSSGERRKELLLLGKRIVPI